MLNTSPPDIHIIHLISAPSGGGAELLVRQLHQDTQQKYSPDKMRSTVISLQNPQNINLGAGEICLNAKYLFSPLSIFKIWRILKQSSSQRIVLHTHLFHSLYIGALLSFLTRFTFFHTEHATWNSRRNYKYFRFIEMIIYRRCHKVISISEGVQKALITWLRPRNDNKFLVIYNGARRYSGRRTPKPSNKTQGMNVVYLGRLAKEKSPDIALNAIAQCQDLIARFVIVGDGPLRDTLRSQAKALNITDKVDFVGWADDPYPYLSDADIYLHTATIEGFGLTIIEALSVGLPVICSDIEGVKEVGENCSSVFFCDPKNSHDFAEKLAFVWSNIIDGHDYSKAAIAHAARFDLNTMFESYQSIYQQEHVK